MFDKSNVFCVSMCTITQLLLFYPEIEIYYPEIESSNHTGRLIIVRVTGTDRYSLRILTRTYESAYSS